MATTSSVCLQHLVWNDGVLSTLSLIYITKDAHHVVITIYHILMHKFSIVPIQVINKVFTRNYCFYKQSGHVIPMSVPALSFLSQLIFVGFLFCWPYFLLLYSSAVQCVTSIFVHALEICSGLKLLYLPFCEFFIGDYACLCQLMSWLCLNLSFLLNSDIFKI